MRPFPERMGHRAKFKVNGAFLRPKVTGEAYRYANGFSGEGGELLAVHKLTYDDGKVEIRVSYYKDDGTKWQFTRNGPSFPPDDMLWVASAITTLTTLTALAEGGADVPSHGE